MKSGSSSKQDGITLVGLIFVLAIVGLVGVLALKVSPTVIEFMSIKKAMATAKASGTTPIEIKKTFDKLTETGYIDSVSSKDLELTPNGDQIELIALPVESGIAAPMSSAWRR